jgi:hypothetical protein
MSSKSGGSEVAVSVFKKRRWSAAGSAMAAGQRPAELSKDVHLWLHVISAVVLPLLERIFFKETTYTTCASLAH